MKDECERIYELSAAREMLADVRLFESVWSEKIQNYGDTETIQLMGAFFRARTDLLISIAGNIEDLFRGLGVKPEEELPEREAR